VRVEGGLSPSWRQSRCARSRRFRASQTCRSLQ
jgi:hypothetical protein